jgi:hypothetical protein
MSVSADTIALLVAAGVGGDALVAIIRSMEADNGPVQSGGAERQRRYRARHRSDVTGDVTSDVTQASPDPLPPLPPVPPLSSFPKPLTPNPPIPPKPPEKDGGEPPIDPSKVLWNAGHKLLIGSGISDNTARGMLGKWRRDHGDELLAVALGKAQREGAIDPVSFIQGCFRARSRDGPVLTSLAETRPAI